MTTQLNTVSLLDLLEKLPEERVEEILSSYVCPLDNDIESFLREKAIGFSKSSLARTYLTFVSDESEPVLAGFFTLAPKSLLLKNVELRSKNFQRRLNRFTDVYEEYDAQIISVILIAQFGKNYSEEAYGLITGDQLIEAAFDKVRSVQELLGGKIVCVECTDTPSLIDFYQSNKFRRFQIRPLGDGARDNDDYLVQLLRYM